MGCGMRLKQLFDNFAKFAIPFGYPGDGFLKMEFEKNVIGSSTRDVLTKRKVTEKTFFNQATLVIRKALPGRGWKEVNIKLFANGGVQMTGVPTPEFSQIAIGYVISQIKEKDPEIFTGDAAITKFRIQLINSDYSINRQIYQDKLHKILSNVYNLFSSHESTIYQGVNTKYYYNKKGNILRPGICECKSACNGQGASASASASVSVSVSVNAFPCRGCQESGLYPGHSDQRYADEDHAADDDNCHGGRGSGGGRGNDRGRSSDSCLRGACIAHSVCTYW